MSECDPISERVCDLSTSFIMTSGAGCGKTYRMVERYTAIIEADVDVTRIIAVTFTEKAAAELKSRVRGECRDRGREAEPPERDRWARAARRLALAPVTTIHGLCARLLRENAIAAGVDPQFGQLDETEQDFLLRDEIRRTLLGRLHDGIATAEAIVARWGLGPAGSVIRGLVEDREDLGELLADAPPAADIEARWREAYESAIGSLLGELMAGELWREAVACLCSVEPCNMDDRAAERHGAALEALERARDTEAPLQWRAQAFGECLALGHRGNVGRKDNWGRRAGELATIRDGLRALGELRDACGERGLAFPPLEDRPTAELAAALRAETAATVEAYAAEKRRRSALDFADLQILARDLLVENPEVLARVRSRYDYVLVDEFQDTNRLQKQIIWRIAGGDADGGQIPSGGVLFVVGDAKQSIYGFRKADVTVFNATVREFEEAGEGCGVLRLKDSWRSRPELVAFHNDLFCHEAVMGLDAAQDFEAAYESVGAVRDGPALSHDVELLLVSSQGDEAGESLSAHDARMREAEALAARIRDIVEGEEITVEVKCDDDTVERRPAQYGHFGVLFQSMTSVGVYEYALRREGIPFYTVAGRGFYNRQEVRDCLNLLSVLENASDELSLVGALRSPMFALSDDAIFWLTRGDESLWRALGAAAQGRHPHQQHLPPDQVERIAHAHELIARLRAMKDRLSLSELVARMLAETGLAATHLAQFAGRQAVANLRKLTDLARSFEHGGEFSLREFIAWLRDLVVNEHREGLAGVHEETADVVQLLTVHKAKGLEWPIVVVPDVTRDPGGGGGPDVMVRPDLGPVPRMELPDGDTGWGAVAHLIREGQRARGEAERRRLLYVALTRARDYLILSSTYGLKGDDGELSAGLWLQALTKALGIHPDEVAHGDVLCPTGEWRCRISRPQPPEQQRPRERPARAPLEVIDQARASARRGEAEELPALARPIEPEAHLPARFAVTDLQRYRTCPHLFRLRHVRGVPEKTARQDWLHTLSAFERGDIAHKALEIIGREGLARAHAVEDAVALATFPGAVASRMGDAEREELREVLAWFLVEARLDGDGTLVYRDWIANARRLRTEVPFVMPLDDALIEGTIDALVEDSDGAWRILDYKTGASPSEQALEGYRFQIGLYCAAVEAITGGTPADAALVLLDATQVRRVDPAEEAEGALAAAREVIACVAAGHFPPGTRCRRESCPLAYACELA